MAAPMRCAVRRLIGGQRPQALYKAVVSPLVEQGHGRLMPRLINGGRPSCFPLRSMSSGGAGCKDFSDAAAAAHPANGNAAPMAPDRRYTGKNMELLFHLFGHVDPNPSDPLWCRARSRERLNNCLLYGMPTAMATWMYMDWESWRSMFAFVLGIGH
ncbi:hypothetical protein VPH35_005257 [Triticum aestivum]